MRGYAQKVGAMFTLTAVVLLIFGQYAIWFYAPLEIQMGVIQKIFYVHLPLAWWAFMAFFAVFVASIVVLVRGSTWWDAFAGACAELGVLCSTLALISGSLWGRVSWNTWWTWDPRLSTTLIMWFVYTGYLVLRGVGIGGAKAAKVRAVLGIVAFLDVPLVFFSARLWRSIHPAVFAAKGGGLTGEMWITVLVNLLAWGFLCLAIIRCRLQNELLQRRVDELLARRYERVLEEG